MINLARRPKRKAHHFFIPCFDNDHKPHFLRHKPLHFYTALLITIKVIVVTLTFVTLPSRAEFSTVTAYKIIELTNQERQAQGLPVLMHSAILDKSSLLKAKDMVKDDYFAHDSPAGVKPWEWFKKAGYNYTYAGENLAMNFSDAENAIKAWMDSPTHKANIMNSNYDEIGVAVMVGKINGRETTIVVQHFGKSFVTPGSDLFAQGQGKAEAEVAGVTLVGGGEATEVTFRNMGEQSKTVKAIYYTKRFFFIFGLFILINLLLTIFIRIKVQHKPILTHAILVLIISILMFLLKFHFLENVSDGPIKIM